VGFPATVGYNLSMVDSTYLPAAMEPLNNDVIPYIGSILSPAAFRLKIQQWLKDHDGYRSTDLQLARPKIPQPLTFSLVPFINSTISYNSSNNFQF